MANATHPSDDRARIPTWVRHTPDRGSSRSSRPLDHPTFLPAHLPTRTHPLRCTGRHGATPPGKFRKCMACSCAAAGSRGSPEVVRPPPHVWRTGDNGPEHYNSQAHPPLPPHSLLGLVLPRALIAAGPSVAEDFMSQHAAEPQGRRSEGFLPPSGARRRSALFVGA